MELYIDSNNLILGRLASRAAKEVLKGNMVYIFNVENVVISGNKKAVTKVFKEKTDRGDPYHGPFYPKRPDRVLKRVVRGMLPYKKKRGREAFKRLKVYAGIPKEFEGKKFTNIKEAENKLLSKSIRLGEVCSRLGKKTW